MTTTNKFAGRCSVCDALVEAYQGKVVKVGSKWQTRCLAHESVEAATQVAAPAAKIAHLTESQFGAIDDAIRDAAIRTEWETAIAQPQRTWQQRQDRLAAIAAVADKHGLR